MIPKVIHWCWLSGEPYPSEIRRCMDSWRKVLKGYEFKLWDINAAKAIGAPWVEVAIKERKWAFAADYIRLWALYSEGGVYLDVDVEVVKDFSTLLDGPLMLGEEGGSGCIEAAVIGAVAGNEAIRRVLESFGDELTGETLPMRMKRVIGGEVELLPSEVFSPKDWKSGKVCVTDATCTIHHFVGTWLSAKERWAQKMGRVLGRWAVPCTRWVFHRFGQ